MARGLDARRAPGDRSLGSGAWWLVFLLLGGLMAWPVRSLAGAAHIARVVVAGGLLARILHA